MDILEGTCLGTAGSHSYLNLNVSHDQALFQFVCRPINTDDKPNVAQGLFFSSLFGILKRKLCPQAWTYSLSIVS